LSATSAEAPARLVLGAGPLIALLHRADPDRSAASVGFRQLTRIHARLVTPPPIVFEVYKWLVYEAQPGAAQLGLQQMRRGLEIVYPGANEFDEVSAVLAAMPRWKGTLEDALVAVTGLRRDAPVWTLNFRDLAAFRNLQFWNPVVA
jgi:predicted nucleic acid-binding protein